MALDLPLVEEPVIAFFVKGKLITKTYMSQNKLQFFFKLKEHA